MEKYVFDDKGEKNMKRRKYWPSLVLGALICFSAFAVTGCTKDADDSENTESEWSDENVDGDGWI